MKVRCKECDLVIDTDDDDSVEDGFNHWFCSQDCYDDFWDY